MVTTEGDRTSEHLTETLGSGGDEMVGRRPDVLGGDGVVCPLREPQGDKREVLDDKQKTAGWQYRPLSQ